MESVNWKRMKYVREIGFQAPFHHRRTSRCIHFDDGADGLVSVASSGSDSDAVSLPLYIEVLPQ